MSYWLALRQTVIFVNKATKCSPHVFLFIFVNCKIADIFAEILQCVMQGFSCFCRKSYSSFSVCPSDSLPLCSATVIMKGISMSFCAKVQKTCLLCVLQSQFVMHISSSAHLTFDSILIAYFLSIVCHSSRFMKSFAWALNIHISRSTCDFAVCGSQYYLKSVR